METLISIYKNVLKAVGMTTQLSSSVTPCDDKSAIQTYPIENSELHKMANGVVSDRQKFGTMIYCMQMGSVLRKDLFAYGTSTILVLVERGIGNL